MADEFEISGIAYRSDKLSSFDQLFIVQKLTPLAASFLPIAQATIQKEASGTPIGIAILKMDVSSLMPLATGIAGLPEADTKAIFGRCLSHVQRGMKSPAGTSWAPLWSATADTIMFDDIDLHTMLTIVAHVVQRDVLPFIAALLSKSIGGVGPAQTPTS